MRVISYRHDGRSGVGVMVDDEGFVELGKAAPGLPETLRAILEMEGDGLARVREAADGKSADLSPMSSLIRLYLSRTRSGRWR